MPSCQPTKNSMQIERMGFNVMRMVIQNPLPSWKYPLFVGSKFLPKSPTKLHVFAPLPPPQIAPTQNSFVAIHPRLVIIFKVSTPPLVEQFDSLDLKDVNTTSFM